MSAPRAFLHKKYTLDELSGKKFPSFKYDKTVYEIRAVVEDVVYVLEDANDERYELGGETKAVREVEFDTWYKLYGYRDSCYGEITEGALYVNPHHEN
jgi:hypothetical protein